MSFPQLGFPRLRPVAMSKMILRPLKGVCWITTRCFFTDNPRGNITGPAPLT
jgi:hypothetical protein